MLKLYDFYCTDCDTTFEKLISKNNQSVTCPDCGKKCGIVPGSKGQLRFKKGKTLLSSDQLHSKELLPGLCRE